MNFKLSILATLAALTVYLWTIVKVGNARGKYQVKAPATDGPPEFMRALRVQMNTLEQLPLLLAPLWLCAWVLGDRWGALGGLIWCVGRIVYALAYYRDPAKRGAGYLISAGACLLLMAGTLVGVVRL